MLSPLRCRTKATRPTHAPTGQAGLIRQAHLNPTTPLRPATRRIAAGLAFRRRATMRPAPHGGQVPRGTPSHLLAVHRSAKRQQMTAAGHHHHQAASHDLPIANRTNLPVEAAISAADRPFVLVRVHIGQPARRSGRPIIVTLMRVCLDSLPTTKEVASNDRIVNTRTSPTGVLEMMIAPCSRALLGGCQLTIRLTRHCVPARATQLIGDMLESARYSRRKRQDP